MFFLLPIRTSISPRRAPYANYALIILNFIVFFLSWIPFAAKGQDNLRSWVDTFMLIPAHPYIWQFISYAFLHGGVMHILGNMYFLWLFGRSVNEKLGNIGYITFYLAGAVFSGIGHTLFSSNPCLGASGAIAAVTGAYLALFPHTWITVFYMFFFIWDTLEIKAFYLIGLKLILWDNIVARTTANVAYDAHLWGYGFGTLAMFIMLGLGLIASTHRDLWYMAMQWNRRRRYRDTIAGGYDPFGAGRVKKVNARQRATQEVDKEKYNKIQSLRSDISERMSQRNIPVATEKYLELIEVDNTQLPAMQHLLDIANQLTSENKYSQAAEAYQKFVNNYKSYQYIEQVELMLGILYGRYLKKPDTAKTYLESARTKLSSPDQLKMCDDELAKLKE